jgi:anaerobic magnesium-protoporphyrin IX monomethyl ester cyclase
MPSSSEIRSGFHLKVFPRTNKTCDQLTPAWVNGTKVVAFAKDDPMPTIALINAPLKSAVCDLGVGHQLPLGLLMIGGPLVDAGFDVKLIDAACNHLKDEEIVQRVERSGADVVMIAHVGSTQAHECCLCVLRAIKANIPGVITVYGGVHPTYHYKTILARHPEVDIVVRGEGETTALDLVQTILLRRGEWQEKCRARPWIPDLSSVPGVAWRREGIVVANPARPTIGDLDAYRIGWELIENWDKYQAFGLGRAAVVQFSRGCPHTCTYCGQWMFWKSWRHRNVKKFVDEMEYLCRKYKVRFFWLADENPTTIKEVWKQVLEEIARRKLRGRMCASIRAQDIVSDADILPLFKKACPSTEAGKKMNGTFFDRGHREGVADQSHSLPSHSPFTLSMKTRPGLMSSM